jgi:hypothetical protein
VDVDDALAPDGSWSPLAVDICTRFQGAYIEISQSGKGLHVMGRRSPEFPKHRVKRKGQKLELYSRGRFILLTGTGAIGDITSDHTAALSQAIATYLPGAPVEVDGDDWRYEPLPGYAGPAEDEELIRRALNSHSARAAFGGGVTFADLWTCNEAALAREYHSNTNDTFDRSSADLALSNNLAWWTGGHHERVLQLMWKSELRREKWEREDYLRATVSKACASVAQRGEFYRPHAVPSGTTTPPAPVPPGTVAQPAVVDSAGALAHTLTMNRKNQFDATLENLALVLGQQTKMTLGFDQFRGRIMIAPAGTIEWRPISDTDMIHLREALGREQRFAPIGKELMRDALQLVAERHSFDTAIAWLDSLKWDGTPRVERFLTTHCGTVDDEYTRAVSRYIWSGLAGRVLSPGCQLDMVVALQSPQGKKKSTGLQGMVPNDEFFTDGLSLHQDDDDFKRLLRGKLVVEIAELAGMSRADIKVVKRTITRRREEWIEKFQTQPTRYPRRCMLFATTNDERFLPPDDTGQRRWLPVEITRIEREAIEADRAQLWAEGAAIYRERGIEWSEAEELAKGRHARYEQTDVWEDQIELWLNTPAPPARPGAMPGPPPGTHPFAIGELLEGALRLTNAQMDARAEKRAGSALRALGFDRRNVKIGGNVRKRWVRVAEVAGSPR